MKIRNTPAAATEPVQTREQGATRRAAAAYGRTASGTRTPPVPPAAGPQDRVTISEEGRARQAAEAERAAALDAGREALGALPGLSDERVAELQARVESGHYGKPEQTRAVAERLAAGLRGEDPETGV